MLNRLRISRRSSFNQQTLFVIIVGLCCWINYVSAFGIPGPMGGSGAYNNPEGAFLAIMIKLSEESEKRRVRLRKAVHGGRKLLNGGLEPIFKQTNSEVSRSLLVEGKATTKQESSTTIFKLVNQNTTDDALEASADPSGDFATHAMDVVRHIMLKFCILSTDHRSNVLLNVLLHRIQGYLVALVFGGQVYKLIVLSPGRPRMKSKKQCHRPSIW